MLWIIFAILTLIFIVLGITTWVLWYKYDELGWYHHSYNAKFTKEEFGAIATQFTYFTILAFMLWILCLIITILT